MSSPRTGFTFSSNVGAPSGRARTSWRVMPAPAGRAAVFCRSSTRRTARSSPGTGRTSSRSLPTLSRELLRHRDPLLERPAHRAEPLDRAIHGTGQRLPLIRGQSRHVDIEGNVHGVELRSALTPVGVDGHAELRVFA